MLAVSMHQPWASAIAQGDKKNETRGRRINLRGLIAIQSAKCWDRGQREAAERIRQLIGKPASYYTGTNPANRRGVVVCVASLVDCEVMTDELIAAQTAHERCLGDWRPGRFAWFLEDVHPLEDPLPLRGQQGLWTLPNKVEAEVLARAGMKVA